ncbi:MAG: DUF3656 domain-containing protein [Bacteroidales bacterium]|nr:DUF3656 domain-containing protein [Bacteroidales bacterium]
MTELELLAPARNADIGIAAIDCGADAVYIAGPEFGARQDAGNSMVDVRRLCDYAHKFGVRIFLTLNTILFDAEIPEATRILKEAAEVGVDAVIAQDLAVFEILRSAQDGMEIHASTQCAIRTPDQARFYESLGASRIVLERQLSLEQIRAIREAVKCEIEFFVHGALCVCYSGQCYMSEAVAGRSANRGACVQACRSLYDLEDSQGKKLLKDKALLSLKDYNLSGKLSDLAEAGVCSFKIEGRLKNISYVRNSVRAYSLALDKLVAANPEKYRRASFGRVEGGFTPDLGKTFNRGYTELFLDGKRGKWSSMDAPKSVGEEIGTVIRISQGRPDNKGMAAAKRGWTRPGPDIRADRIVEVIVDLDNPATALRNGDGFTFVSKDHNEIRGFRGDICRGERILCKDVPGLYVGARLRRNLSSAFEKEIDGNLPERRIPVSVSLKIDHAGTPSEPGEVHPRFAAAEYRLSSEAVPAYVIKVEAKSEDGRLVEFEVEAGNQDANNVERMEAMFKSQIEKSSGVYSFTLARLDSGASYGKLPFLSASAINGIRRDIAERLDKTHCGRGHLRPKAEESTPHIQEIIDYKSNISNNIAREVLKRLGAEKIEDAFEISHIKGAELMRTKYCIRHELGICPKGVRQGTDSSASGLRMTGEGPGMAQEGGRMAPGPLFLINNGKRYRLDFHCSTCEMIVSEA